MSKTPAIVALERADAPYSVHEYTHDPAAPSYGMEASAALGRNPDQVFKTLVVVNAQDVRHLAVGILPVGNTLSLKKLAHAWGVKRVTMAEPRDAERSTGYVIGGISPLGQRRRLPTFIDSSAQEWGQILVSGGQRGLDLELDPHDLAALLDAPFTDLRA